MRHRCNVGAGVLNSSRTNDAICRHRSGSTLAQVMACCLTAPVITWTNVDLSSNKSHEIHLRTLSWEDLKQCCWNTVANCDPWIQRATKGPTMDGLFGDQWICYVLQEIFRKKSGQTTPQMHWYHIYGLTEDCSISIANALEILQSCRKPSVCLFVLVSE